METYAYGHDFGNAETCGVLIKQRKKLIVTIPTAMAQGSLDDLSKLGITLNNDNFVFKSQASPTELYVGSLALEQSSMSFSGRGDPGRYWTDKSLTMLLTAAAVLIDDREFALSVVTGLPVQTYLDDPESRQRIKNTLNGTHRYRVNGVDRVAHVRVERVIMEGAGASIAYGNRGSGAISGIIDIGGRTTDLYAAEGQRPQRQFCNGKALGVEIAGDLLSNNFKARYGFPLRANDVRKCLRAYAQKTTYPVVSARGQKVTDLEELTKDALKQIGDEIVSFVSSIWSESEGGSEVASSFASVLCIGGGAYYFAEQLLEKIPHLQVAVSPETANACGYAVFAEQQLQQNLRVVRGA